MEAQREAACLLAVRIIGTVGKNPQLETTLEGLGLRRKFEAGLYQDDSATRGMLQRVQALVAWGEPEVDTVASLLSERAELAGGSGVSPEFARVNFRRNSVSDLAESIISGNVSLRDLETAGVRLLFRLHPPRAGFKRSTRRIFGDGGELGYRGSEINGLLRRMI